MTASFLFTRGHRYLSGHLTRSKNLKTPFFKSFGQFAQFWPTGGHWLQQICSHSSITQTKIKISSWNFQHLFIMCLCKFDKKNLAIAQSACQLRPISAKTLEVSSDSICWDIWKRKEMVRFWTYLSNLLEGIFNTF